MALHITPLRMGASQLAYQIFIEVFQNKFKELLEVLSDSNVTLCVR